MKLIFNGLSPKGKALDFGSNILPVRVRLAPSLLYFPDDIIVAVTSNFISSMSFL